MLSVLPTGRIIVDGDTTGILEGDSQEYEILENAAREAAPIKGPSIEFGVRLGAGSVLIMNQNPPDKMHIAVDPYGCIEYADDVHGTFDTDYSNNLRNACQYALQKWAYDNNKNLSFLIMEDTEFFKRFADGYPTYDKSKTLHPTYSFVHFDGPHTTEAVKEEMEFFINRITPGGMLVFDDINLYRHQEVEDWFMSQGRFVPFQKGIRKASYRKLP